MPEKLRQKLLFIVMNAVITLALGFLLLAFTERGEKWLRTEKAIDDKADVTYVDNQDNAIKINFVEYKQTHQIQHSLEYKLMKAEVKAVKSNQEIMMRFWNIPQLAADK